LLLLFFYELGKMKRVENKRSDGTTKDYGRVVEVSPAAMIVCGKLKLGEKSSATIHTARDRESHNAVLPTAPSQFLNDDGRHHHITFLSSGASWWRGGEPPPS
jgi:hypothetical protein